MSALEDSLRKVYGLAKPQQTTSAKDAAAMLQGATSSKDVRAIMGKGAISNKDIDIAMRALGLPDDAPISTQKKLQVEAW